MKIDFENGAVLLVNKPKTWTSFDVVNKLRYVLLKKMYREQKNPTDVKRKLKVGHAGTLDPLATGLLIICVGKETKQIDTYMATEKAYEGTITLGATTPSYDLETEPNAFFATDHITEELIHKTALSMVGTYMQVPPVFSAIKKEGKRLYVSARQGEVIVPDAREVRIHSFEISSIVGNEIQFSVVCSKGTYIRSLAYDFGQKLNSGAYLSELCRTRSGVFHLSNAYDLPDLIRQLEAD